MASSLRVQSLETGEYRELPYPKPELDRLDWTGLQTWMALGRLELGDKTKDCRLFVIDWSAVEPIVDDVKFYLESAGITSPEALDRYLRASWEAPQPFDRVFVAIDHPLVLHEPRHAESGCMLGWWCSQGFVCRREMHAIIAKQLPTGQISLNTLQVEIVRNVDGTLQYPFKDGSVGALPGPDALTVNTAIALVIPGILFDIIQRQANVVRQTGISAIKRARLQGSQQARPGTPRLPLPRDYHEILIQGSVRWENLARQSIIRSAPAWVLDHTVDVRAHWWVRERHGEGLVPPELRERLDPRYHWADDRSDDLDDLDRALLRERCIERRRPGHWQGVLRRWVGAYKRGPEGSPYVPASWRITVPEEGL